MSWWPRLSMRGRLVSTACATTLVNSSGVSSRVILPRVIRETSSRSSTRRVSCRELTGDDVTRPGDRVVGRRQLSHDLDRHADRRQRVPELVPEHRQELVLATAGLLELLLGQLARCDVHAASDVAAERTIGPEIRNPVVEDPAVLAIVAAEPELHGQRLPARECPFAGVDA